MSSACQSCAKPLIEANKGTDFGGGKCEIYCNTCFLEGVFTQVLTLAEMQARVALALRNKRIPSFVQTKIVRNLENLMRWKVEKK